MSKRIAIDAMGGDQAPEALVAGALRACSGDGPGVPAERLLLVGDRERIAPLLGGVPIEILHATQVVEMADSAAAALRSKPDSSIARAVGSVRDGTAGAVVSMGNTGACVAASTRVLGTLSGIRRPGIAVTFDLTGKPVTMLDMGANSAPKPGHLYQYGIMGSVFAQDCLIDGAKHPRVGLLNIGEEAGKGTDLLKEALPLFKASSLNFVGNVEPGDIFSNATDVVVTDGFTGNVVLKLMEEFSAFMLQLVMRELKAHDAAWGGQALENVRRRIDYAEYGGAMLLGVNGVVVIGHGRSDARAVSNAIRLAVRALDTDVNADIVEGVNGALASPGSSATET
jgi:glycerol-3-phosphate acyltransferase PlsX